MFCRLNNVTETGPMAAKQSDDGSIKMSRQNRAVTDKEWPELYIYIYIKKIQSVPRSKQTPSGL